MAKLDNIDLKEILKYRISNNRSFYKVINREDDLQSIYKDLGVDEI
ncbi:MAG: hypothetical protein Q4P34_04920 [Tissierellia bacterium]|nr:hypothetical protein [Tissierellia bacterium]